MTEPDYINLDTTAISVKKVIFSLPKFLNNYISISGYLGTASVSKKS